ncbi:tRNA(Ile)-lysidine synthase [Candidatus Rhabdochlamydia oedothoracis]|uniref:tRNA(Ile)-lysidine synthase n=1 Tax=Candidatus Rhabdochlamydia oedothoracis TaxID=2720720 RepID=A0ABX8UZX2_9BACT|nr:MULTISPECIES: tRNA lysidine(34) synthetase TilS [Rhabdochlamydia]KAG6559597.1 tRNA(Ile)-lysidine synthase [Candidatus Rhabdochlamydia sp. W815]QYF48513.1 tRNA(Ile)-lysidine synthase [Candidatus Rhabdochlamydia oedothoracis]
MLKIKDPLKTVKDFLKSKNASNQPILMGYSGGCDSKALLYLSLECSLLFKFSLCVAHIDHGWREESGKQAKMLQEEVEELGLPFYLKVLHFEDFEKKNLEQQGREKRLQFFKELYQKLDCQALLLAHQAEDQAEVVLKRICEGAHLTSLRGMQPDMRLEEMRIWRPLLPVSKKTLRSWLEKRSLVSIEDPTNENSQFLRARMRKEIFPELSRLFGKEIAGNLCKLGKQAQELDSYFYQKNLILFTTQKEDCSKVEWDLNPFLPLDRVELHYAVKQWLRMQKVILPSSFMDIIMEFVVKNKIKKEFIYKEKLLKIDSGRLILIKNSIKK